MPPPACSLDMDNHEEVVSFLRKAFSHYYDEFDNSIAEHVRRVLREHHTTGVTMESTQQLLMRAGVDVEQLTTSEEKKCAERLKTVLTVTHVLLSAQQNEIKGLFWHEVETLLAHYDAFRSVKVARELQLLLWFRNFMVAALRLVPAKGNKLFLLKVVERLEGSEEVYITGTGQKPAVSRRIAIYEKEGNIKARTFKNNSNAAAEEIAPSSGSEKKRQKTTSPPRLLENSIDDLMDASSAVTNRIITPPSLPPRAALALPVHGQPQRPMDRQLSEVASGATSLDLRAHVTLLAEKYEGSFTEVIRDANIT